MKKSLLLVFVFIVIQIVFGVIATLFIDTTPGNGAAMSPVNSPSYIWALCTSLLLSNLLIIVIVYFFMKRRNDIYTPMERQIETGTEVSVNAARCPFVGQFKRPANSFIVILTFLTMIPLMYFLNCINETFKIPDLLQNEVKEIAFNPIGVITVAIVGPIAEEICFRMGVINLLRNKGTTNHRAIFISAIIFAIIHFNPAQMVCAFIMGLFLGYLYVKTQSLVLPIACHILNNGLSIILGWIFGLEHKMSDWYNDHTYFFCSVALSALVTAFFFVMLKKKIVAAS